MPATPAESLPYLESCMLLLEFLGEGVEGGPVKIEDVDGLGACGCAHISGV